MCTIRPSDIHGAADVWPIGRCSLEGTKLLFPGSTTDDDARRAVRVAQRALGSGQRRLAFNEISALLCFWKQGEDGTLGWQWGDSMADKIMVISP